MKRVLLVCMVLFFALCFSKDVFSKDQVKEEWKSCEVDDDCTAGVLGCYYWQPVNKKYVKDLIKTYFTGCLQSINPGMQPVTACVEKKCRRN